MINLHRKKIAKLYKRLGSYKKVASYLKINSYYIEKILKGHSCVIMPGGRNKYKINSKFFNKDSIESFYWAGFIAADGCVMKNTLAINIVDKEHMYKFKKCIDFGGPVRHIGHSDRKDEYRISFEDKSIVENLKRFGIVERKSLIYKVPSYISNNKLFNHFLRGYFDGDGTICISKIYKVPQFYMGICGTRQCIGEFIRAFEKNCNTKRNKKIQMHGKIFSVSYGGNVIVKRIMQHLYKNSTDLTRLDRKYNLMLQNTNLPDFHKHSSVIGKNIKNGKIITFEYIKDAQKNGFNRCCITDCCRGRQKTHKGYIWRYK